MTDGTLGPPPIARRPQALVELPLSPHQQSWWAMCTRYPQALTPLLTVVYRLRGPLVVEAWLRAADAVADRHEGLRMRFVSRERGPVQVVEPPNGLDVDRVDLRDLPAAAREDRARALLRERAHGASDIERGRLVTACLLRLADDDHLWMLAVHHILADGASMAIIDQEMGVFYRAFVDGVEPALPDLSVRYGDYLVWYQAAHHQQHDDDRRYWARVLDGVPMLRLRTDRPRPTLHGHNEPGAEVDHVIGGDLLARVGELGRAERFTPYMVLLAALQVLLIRQSGQRDFCFGIPVIGRHNRTDLEPLVGLFSNLVTARCQVPDDLTFREFLTVTRRTVLGALAHQDLPFSEVVPYLNAPPDNGRPQVFPVLFDFDQPGQPDLPGLRAEWFALDAPRSVHDLVIVASVRPSGLGVRCVYNSAVFTAATVAGMMRGLEQILRAGVERPDTPLSALVSGPG